MPRPPFRKPRPFGLGTDHDKTRARLLADLVEGSLCELCGNPMYRTQALHADHEHKRVDGGYQATRLVHASCNTREGALMTNRKLGYLPPTPSNPTSENW